METLNPSLAKEWHPTKNGNLTPHDVTLGSGKKVWWKCDSVKDHEWKSAIYSRSINRGCPICSGRVATISNSLATLNPQLAKEWHPTKNEDFTPFDYKPYSNKKVWWKCDIGEDHVWQSAISARSNGTGCPVCRGLKVVKSNSLALLNPDLAKEWHQTKNDDLTPFDVTQNSNKNVWWKCDKGEDHEWDSKISDRTNGNSCPVCSGQKVVKSNSLALLNPDLADEWHPTKNEVLTPFDVTQNSGIKVWWKCDKGEDHEWNTTTDNRSKGTGCPFCTLTPQSRQELTIAFELKQFFNINPKGFKTKVQGKLWTIDIYIPEINLGIEFDGSYWHKGKRELDKLKTEKLVHDGFKIMRIREEPLKAITEIDIISKTPFDAKAVINDILTYIMQSYSLDAKRIKKIGKYLLKEEIQNEKGLDAYIDKILTEKAEKNNS